MKNIAMLFVLAIMFAGSAFADTASLSVNAPLMTREIQAKMTPVQALDRLMAGNERFVKRHRPAQRDYIEAAGLTVEGQYPAAIVLSCIDSRVPPEIVFDQGVGNIFVTRVAANVLSDDILGGMEYATAVVGARIVLVMGHEHCGAVKGVCKGVKLGHLTGLLQKISPAMQEASDEMKTRDCADSAFIDRIAEENVEDAVREIPKRSPVIKKLVDEGKVKIVGAMYHLGTGRVTIIDE